MTTDEIFGLAMYLPASTYRKHPHPLTYIGTKIYRDDIYNLYRNDEVEMKDTDGMAYSDRYYKISHQDMDIDARMVEIHKDLVKSGMIRERMIR